jgi:hypothetical protein
MKREFALVPRASLSNNNFTILPGRGGLFHPHTPGRLIWKTANLNSRLVRAAYHNTYVCNQSARFKPILDSYVPHGIFNGCDPMEEET